MPGIVPEQGLGLFSRIEIAVRRARLRSSCSPAGRVCVWRVVEDLDAVLHDAEEHIGAGKLGHFLVGEQSLLGEHMQGLEGILLPERPVAAGVDELERLDEELDLADAPWPSFTSRKVLPFCCTSLLIFCFISRTSAMALKSRYLRYTRARCGP